MHTVIESHQFFLGRHYSGTGLPRTLLEQVSRHLSWLVQRRHATPQRRVSPTTKPFQSTFAQLLGRPPVVSDHPTMCSSRLPIGRRGAGVLLTVVSSSQV